MEEDTVRGSPGIVAVVERTLRGSPSALLSRGSRFPARGEPPLQWMDARDLTFALLLLDDVAESMERENLDIRFLAVMNALNEATGALREIIIPCSQVSALWSPFFSCPRVFIFLILVFFLESCCP